MKLADIKHGTKTEVVRVPKREGEYFDLLIKPIPPTWRDLWAILRRRYTPRMSACELLDVDGLNACMKDVFAGDRLEAALYKSPFLDWAQDSEGQAS